MVRTEWWWWLDDGGGINRSDEQGRGQRAEAAGDIARTRREWRTSSARVRARDGEQDERKRRWWWEDWDEEARSRDVPIY